MKIYHERLPDSFLLRRRWSIHANAITVKCTQNCLRIYGSLSSVQLRTIVVLITKWKIVNCRLSISASVNWMTVFPPHFHCQLLHTLYPCLSGENPAVDCVVIGVLSDRELALDDNASFWSSLSLMRYSSAGFGFMQKNRFRKRSMS